MDFRKYLLATQIYIHVAFIIGLFSLPIVVSIPTILIAQIIFVGLCGTVFFHRVVAHKNKIHPVTEKILILLSWIGASGSAVAWAGTHRMHHRFSDSERDPHSPKYHGKIKAYWMSSGDSSIVRYVPDLLRNNWYVFQHKNYFKVLTLLHVFGLIFLPLSFYWMILVVPAFLMWFAGSTINVFCHDDAGPRNISLLGYLHAGEGWHRNHHEQPANFSFRHPGDWGAMIYNMIRLRNDAKA